MTDRGTTISPLDNGNSPSVGHRMNISSLFQPIFHTTERIFFLKHRLDPITTVPPLLKTLHFAFTVALVTLDFHLQIFSDLQINFKYRTKRSCCILFTQSPQIVKVLLNQSIIFKLRTLTRI